MTDVASVLGTSDNWIPENTQTSRSLPNSSSEPSWTFKIYETIKNIPFHGLVILRDPFYLRTVLQSLNLVTQISSLLKYSFFPVISLFLIPFSFCHACIKAKENTCLLIDALRVKEFANAFFFGCQGIDCFGDILGILAKGANGTLQLATVKHFLETSLNQAISGPGFLAGFGIAVTLVIPIILIVAGSIGTIATGQLLYKNIQAYRQFEAPERDADLKSVFEFLTLLKSPSQDSPKNNVDTELLKSNYAISEEHFDHMQEKIQTFLNNCFQLGKFFEFEEEIPQDLKETMENVKNTYENCIFENNDFSSQVDQLINSYTEIKTYAENHLNSPEDFIKKMDEQISNLQEMKQQLENSGLELIDEIKGELRRNILINVINLILSLATIVSGVLALTHPQWTLVATIMGMSIGTTELSLLIFKKTISMETWRSIEITLHKKFPDSTQIEDAEANSEGSSRGEVIKTCPSDLSCA